MTNFRPIFENDWCGIETFLKDVLSPRILMLLNYLIRFGIVYP